MKIIFDLDGTLICSKRRLYELFCFLVGDVGLSFSAYWDLKFSGQTNQQILIKSLGFSEVEAQYFVSKWMELIETDEYLRLDRVIDGVPGFLKALKRKHSLYLCTARQSKAKACQQLFFLGISDCFDQLFITEQYVSKEQLIRESEVTFSSEDWLIGDTGHDILTGKALGLRTCAVLSGFMQEKALVKYAPDVILSDVCKAEFLL